LDKALAIIKNRTILTAAGRTMRRCMPASFFFMLILSGIWMMILFPANKILPDDIAVFEIIPMQGLLSCPLMVQRSYDYFILL